MRCQSSLLDSEYVGRVVYLTSIVDEFGTKMHYHFEDRFHHLKANVYKPSAP